MKMDTKKTLGLIAAVAVIGLIIALLTGFIDIDQTEEGALPDVDVEIEADAGKLPEFDVDTGSVEVGTETETVLVPKVVLDEEEVEIPTIDVEAAEDDGEE